MKLRWAIPIALWTMLSGPVLARPRPPAVDRANQVTMTTDSSTNRTNGHE
jgi:hypothetical protein